MKSLDTRDLQGRLEELADLRDLVTSIQEELSEAGDKADHNKIVELLDNAKLDFGDEEAAELMAIEELRDDVGSEWKYGVQLIPESEFEDYARELAEDIGAFNRDMNWPCSCIDWSKAADELRQDYSRATFRGTDYLYRA